MAIIAYGPLATEVRGSIGGTTFSKNRFAKIVRAKVSPVHRPTTKRTAYKTRFSSTVYRYLNTITPEQRAAWETLGDNTTFINALGQEYHPTGNNLYLRTNILYRYMGQTWIDTAPATATRACDDLVFSISATGDIECTMADEPVPNYRIIFWLSLPQLPAINYNRGPYLRDTYELASDLWAEAPWEIFEAAGLIEDLKYFLRWRAIDATGKVSAAFYDSIIRDTPI